MILRIDQPYDWIEGWQNDNSVTRVIKKFQKKELVEDVVDWYNNPTFIHDLCVITSILLEEKKTGIYHAVGPDFINRFEWAKITAEIFGFEPEEIIPISSDKLNISVKRAKVKLLNEKIVQETGYKLKNVREGISEMLEKNYSS